MRFGFYAVPILKIKIFSSDDYMVGFNKVSFLENSLSKGTRPLGIKIPFNSITSWLSIEFLKQEGFSSSKHLHIDQLMK